MPDQVQSVSADLIARKRPRAAARDEGPQIAVYNTQENPAYQEGDILGCPLEWNQIQKTAARHGDGASSFRFPKAIGYLTRLQRAGSNCSGFA